MTVSAARFVTDQLVNKSGGSKRFAYVHVSVWTRRLTVHVCYGDISFSSAPLCFVFFKKLNYEPVLQRDPSFPGLCANPRSLLLWENRRAGHHFLCCPLGSLLWIHGTFQQAAGSMGGHWRTGQSSQELLQPDPLTQPRFFCDGIMCLCVRACG